MESKGGSNQAVPSTLKDLVDSPTPTDSCPPLPASDETKAYGCRSGSVGRLCARHAVFEPEGHTNQEWWHTPAGQEWWNQKNQKFKAA